MKLLPKQYYFFKQLIPFIVIWTLFGFIYVFIEYGILGTHPVYPGTGNQYDYQSNFLYTLPSTVIMGTIQGAIEVLWLKSALQSKVVWKKILLKTLFYTILIIIFLIVLTYITSSINARNGDLNRTVYEEVSSFFYSFAFWSIVLYIGVAILLTHFIVEVKDYVGDHIFENFLLGKYNTPRVEERIFMFLDMRSSTTIAERMGHREYFKFISDYYADMTDAILEAHGEIYQYVGDEIVISWPKKKGLYKNNCINCFYSIRKTIRKRAPYYKKTYGQLPNFKAGLHLGKVTTGEIGILKKEIIYTGDVLNTTARIQGKCNTFNAEILISEVLKIELDLATEEFEVIEVDKLKLRGKQEDITIFTLLEMQ